MKKLLTKLSRSRSWHLRNKHQRADRDGTFASESPSPSTIPSDDSSLSEASHTQDATNDWRSLDDSTDFFFGNSKEPSAPEGVEEDISCYLETLNADHRLDRIRSSTWRSRAVRQSRNKAVIESINSRDNTVWLGRVRSSFWRRTLKNPEGPQEADSHSYSIKLDRTPLRRVRFFSDADDDLFSVETPNLPNEDSQSDSSQQLQHREEFFLESDEFDLSQFNEKYERHEKIITKDDNVSTADEMCYGCWTNETLHDYVRFLARD